MYLVAYWYLVAYIVECRFSPMGAKNAEAVILIDSIIEYIMVERR